MCLNTKGTLWQGWLMLALATSLLTVGVSAAALRPNSAQESYHKTLKKGHLHYWDILFANPFGLVPACQQVPATCSSAASCCSSATKPADCIKGQCCLKDGVECPKDGRDLNCCSGFCFLSLTSSQLECSPGCAHANTLLYVQGEALPVPLAQVRIGQYVQCIKTSDNKMTLQTLDWCQVVGWSHAKQLDELVPHTRVNFTRPGARAQSSLVVSITHALLRLTQASLSAGTQRTSIEDFGALKIVQASTMRPGDLIPVVTDEANPASSFTAVTISSVENIQGADLHTYVHTDLPILDKPYDLVADGTVFPL